MPDFEDLAQNPLGQEKDDKHENDAENQCPVIGNRADKRPQQDDDGGAEHRSQESDTSPPGGP